MYAKNIRPSAKGYDGIARPRNRNFFRTCIKKWKKLMNGEARVGDCRLSTKKGLVRAVIV